MLTGKTLSQLLSMGGGTLYFLVFISVVSLALIVERLLVLHRRAAFHRKSRMEEVRASLGEHPHARQVEEAHKRYGLGEDSLSRVLDAGLSRHGRDEKTLSEAMEIRIEEETATLGRRLAVVGTIGGTVVYVGLFGTVLGIIGAFQDIALTAESGSSMVLVINGIAGALICTAAGIGVAVPSVIAFNLLTERIDGVRRELDLAARELLGILRG